MFFKKLLSRFRYKDIVIEVENVKIPSFNKSPIIREKMIFSGKVQGVGFRLGVYLVANKIGLTGWVKNREDGKVEVEIQGEKDKIRFLKEFMYSINSAKVTNIKETELNIKEEEKTFIAIY